MIDSILDIQITYIAYVVILLFANSISKLVFDNEYGSKTQKVVAFTTGIIFVPFALLTGKLLTLIFLTFFTFGFYDMVGRYIERYTVKLIQYVSGFFK